MWCDDWNHRKAEGCSCHDQNHLKEEEHVCEWIRVKCLFVKFFLLWIDYAKCIFLFYFWIESVKFFKESELNYWIKRVYLLIDFYKIKIKIPLMI